MDHYFSSIFFFWAPILILARILCVNLFLYMGSCDAAFANISYNEKPPFLRHNLSPILKSAATVVLLFLA